MEAVAKLRHTKGSPRKMRLVVDLVRGLNVEEALNILKFNPKQASKPLSKLLRSGISNWEQTSGLRAENSQLYIKELFVTGGRVLKRYRPATMGRPHKIRKRTNHVTMTIGSRLDLSDQVAENKENKENEEA